MFAKFSRPNRSKGSKRGKIRLIETFASIQEASACIDKMLRQDKKLCANIIRNDGKFAVQTVVWQ